MLPFEQEAAAAIAAAFAEPLNYTGAGLVNAAIIGVDSRGAKPGGDFAVLSRMFCIAGGQLPGEPAKGDIVGQGITRWRVIDKVYDRSVDEHQLFVELAPPAP